MLDKKPQFAYLLNSIRPRKRYSKWFKQEKIEKLDIVSEYFGYSKSKAKDIIEILTDDQIKIIKEKLQKGGTNAKERKT
jgi:flavorubredoxin